jgi:hypothetical protein
LTRRKGEITARMNERDYPHIVELPLPSSGFRSHSDDMLAFYRKRGKELDISRTPSKMGKVSPYS